MKQFIFTCILSLFGITYTVNAQESDYEKLENLKYYLSSLKDNAQSMRYYTDSTKIISLLDQLDVITTALENELNTIALPEPEIVEVMPEVEAPTTDETNDNMGDSSTWPEMNDESQNDDSNDNLGISKYMPFKNKFNTSFEIQFGINALQQGNAAPSGILSPEINPGGSWYWDFALTRRARLGGKNSKVALNYGISYLKNRFKLENDLRLTAVDGVPVFQEVADLKDNPKLNIGYLNVPLSLTFSLSKKTKLKVGGYVGYRVHTVQKFQLKTQNEKINEQRYAGYELNDWMYGATASLDIAGFDLIARYNFSKVFKDNPNYDFNTFMIGTSVSLF
jgi:Outer membrane protein beta-barrel domain